MLTGHRVLHGSDLRINTGDFIERWNARSDGDFASMVVRILSIGDTLQGILTPAERSRRATAKAVEGLAFEYFWCALAEVEPIAARIRSAPGRKRW